MSERDEMAFKLCRVARQIYEKKVALNLPPEELEVFERRFYQYVAMTMPKPNWEENDAGTH